MGSVTSMVSTTIKQEKTFRDVLDSCKISDLISGIEWAYDYLKEFDSFDFNKFVKCVDEVIVDTKNDVFAMNDGYSWEYYFDGGEIVENMLIYHLDDVPPEEFVCYFKRFTDLDVVDIRERIALRCVYFGGDESVFEEFL